MKKIILLAGLVALTGMVWAQERSSNARESVVTTQADTQLRNELEALKGQLKAVQDETKRRMACQQSTQISTASGCTDIPGLENAVVGRRATLNAPVPTPTPTPTPLVTPVTPPVVGLDCKGNPYQLGCPQIPYYCADHPGWKGCPGCENVDSWNCYDPNSFSGNG